MNDAGLPPLAVSMGEPAGIGPDLILQLYAERKAHALPPFLVYGNLDFLQARARRLGLAIDISPASAPLAAGMFPDALPVANIDGTVPDTPGEMSPRSAGVVVQAISQAVSDTLRDACRAIVTAPIHKANLYGAGFGYPGHTEFLADLCAEGEDPPLPVMMLAHADLRVVPATVHVPLSKVPRLLTSSLLIDTGRIVAHDLRTRFGIASPRLAMTGLNPHAGEDRTIGTEDAEIIAPAVQALAAEGIEVVGPLPADTVFYPPHWRRYDAVVAMYHDQALIPIKTMAFDEAVNVTLGLPIVRTSPDHGTALDLAGSGKASPTSLLAALRLADRMTGGTAAEPR